MINRRPNTRIDPITHRGVLIEYENPSSMSIPLITMRYYPNCGQRSTLTVPVISITLFALRLFTSIETVSIVFATTVLTGGGFLQVLLTVIDEHILVDDANRDQTVASISEDAAHRELLAYR